MDSALFARIATLSSSVALLFGIMLLWRRSLEAYVSLFRWQSAVLALLFLVIGSFGDDPELYFVAAFFIVVKVIIMPAYLQRLQRRVGSQRELEPYVNVATSLIIAGFLTLFAYAATMPLVTASALPTRHALPLAMGLIFVGLLVLVTRKQALTQIVGFLVLENGIALLAALGTFGVPLIIEMGVFLDVLMGFLVMQVLVYQIHGTFDSIDVGQLSQLKD